VRAAALSRNRGARLTGGAGTSRGPSVSGGYGREKGERGSAMVVHR
jgi:hypothetical protein